DYTPAHRQSTLSWMTSVYDANLAAAAADRRMAPAALRRTLEAGPYLAEDAVRLMLVDRTGQVREAVQSLVDRAGEDSELV
nr:S49 family peptidase [Shewanella shenzhenensis]